MEQALVRCHNIATLAGLLAATGLHRGNEPLDAVLASNTGDLILQELHRLEALLTAMQKT